MKITLGDIKTNTARLLSMSGTDARVTDYINEAQERLLYKGKWAGTYARYAINSSNGTITWPRELETIESVAVADDPAIVRNEWFEFLESGYGIQDSTDSDAANTATALTTRIAVLPSNSTVRFTYSTLVISLKNPHPPLYIRLKKTGDTTGN